MKESSTKLSITIHCLINSCHPQEVYINSITHTLHFLSKHTKLTPQKPFPVSITHQRQPFHRPHQDTSKTSHPHHHAPYHQAKYIMCQLAYKKYRCGHQQSRHWVQCAESPDRGLCRGQRARKGDEAGLWSHEPFTGTGEPPFMTVLLVPSEEECGECSCATLERNKEQKAQRKARDDKKKAERKAAIEVSLSKFNPFKKSHRDESAT